MKVCINYNDPRWLKYKIDIEKYASAAAVNVSSDAEVSIILTNDEEIHKLNLQYRNINKPTNVLSFELGDDILLGDIYISLDTVLKEAKKEKISIQDHVAHMIVHGMLHLQGYDHIKEDDAIIMETKETEVLEKFGIKNPYSTDLSTYKTLFNKLRGKFNVFNLCFFKYVLLSVLGVGASFGFAPFNMWWVTLISIGLAYFIFTCNKSNLNLFKDFLMVLPFSAAYSISMFWWVLHSIYVIPELTQQFAIWTIPAIIGIGLLGGFIFAIPFVAILRICTFPSLRPILFASVWSFVLWLREWLLTGFPWNPIANIFMSIPLFSNSMALWGAIGTTFVIIGLIASIVELIRNYRSKFNWLSFIVFILLSIFGLVYGFCNLKKAETFENVTPVIRIVQPAQSAIQKATHSREDAINNARKNISLLKSLASEHGIIDLVVFPETSYPFVVLDNDYMPLGSMLNNNVIIGALSYSDGAMYNSMIVSDSGGNIQKIYSKSHLVPFGEYRPFGDIIPTPGQLESGTGPEIISVNISDKNFSFSPAICYEIIFSDSLIPKDNTPDAIINITNDTWFGSTPGTYQHLDMVRRYAIESGVPIIRSNYSGISAFILSDGKVISEIPIGKTGHIDGTVYGAHETTYRSLGRNIWMIIILSFSCIYILYIQKFLRRR